MPYEEEIKKYIEALKILKPKLVILHGSIARKEFGLGSDVDLIVVSDNLPDKIMDRIKLLYEIDETKAPLDIKGYKSEEIRKMIKKGNPLIMDAMEDGIILFADENFLKEILEFYKEERKNFKRIEKGWIKLFLWF
ncbi:MAG: nucleotidyltransferase domain-containing protein [Candidatus Methanomethylicota archaeon]|uniref:Nucleotidyltransferase domain-containing protein n=1 Tax=Thermoproteota archaeon TaxID=2056631 RepID=A0A520KFZ4_9CREN|nr:MAG: nucleotidyltransferase domain-containing protein [Candidatus Verstraetearchaeota archaeon]TDA38719.1 MAG: nucleotidyltransferase domain-containing protein [Candidatus Verstraetearchaeota archaeon]